MLLNRSALDPASKFKPGGFHAQYIAELIYEQMKRGHPDLAEDPNAYLIGFIDADMYSVSRHWPSTFTERDPQRDAVISTNGMQDDLWSRMQVGTSVASEHFQARIRRILLKDVAILYWKLPLNNDPSSLLDQPLDPDLPTESIY